MLSTRNWFGISAFITALGLSTPALGQGNVFEAGGGNPGTYDFATNTFWGSGGGPATWDDGTKVGGSIGFDLQEGAYTINGINLDYTGLTTLSILSESTIVLDGTGSFSFANSGRIDTGDGALHIQSGVSLILTENLIFDYGSGDSDNPAETIGFDVAGGDSLNFNLIVEGLISDNAEPVTGKLTFTGDGWALLTGGISADQDNSSFSLEVKNGASLMLSGDGVNNNSYQLTDGVTLGYNGSFNGREDGHGLFQLVDSAVLNTLNEQAGGVDPTQNGGEITMSGYAAMLVGTVNLLDPNLSGLGFGDTNDHVASGSATQFGTASVYTSNLTLGGNAAVIVGNGSTIESTTTDEGKLDMTGESQFIVQEGGSAAFNTLDLAGGTFIDGSNGVGNVRFNEDSSIGSSGTFIASGTNTDTQFDKKLTSEGTIEVTSGAAITVGDNANLESGSTTTITGAGSQLNLNDQGTAVAGTQNILGGLVQVLEGGTLNVGYDDQASDSLDLVDLTSTGVLFAQGTGSKIVFNGDVNASGLMLVENQATLEINQTLTELETANVDLTNATIGGGSTENDVTSAQVQIAQIYDSNGDPEDSFAIGELFAGTYNTDTQAFDAGWGFIEFDTAGMDIDMLAGNLIFGLGYTEDTLDAYNTQIAMDGGGRILLGTGTTIELVIGGAEFIPTGTSWDLFQDYDSDVLGNWDSVTLEGFNTVTRTFEVDGDGIVSINTNYLNPAQGGGQVVEQRGAWLNDAVGSVTDTTNSQALLFHELDQLGTTSLYQSALARLGPESIASGLQVVSDTNAFNAYHEALSDMRTGNELGRPGPARRPLSQSSQSMLASQDEADTIRSQYGYGNGPESGQRRQEDDNMVAFVQGYGRTINLDNMANVIGVDGNQWGVLAGVGGQLSENSVLGLLLGYDDFNGDLNDNFGSVDVGTVRVGPFFGWANENWNVDLALTGGYNDWNGTRRNTTLGRDYNWSTGGWQIDFSAGLGYRIPLGGGVNLVPEGSFVYSFIQTDSYSEEGNQPGTLSVDTNDLNAIIGRVGASVEVISIAGLILEGRLGWQGNYSFGGDIETGVLGFGSPLPGTPEQVDRNNLYYGGQITWMPTWDVSLSFRYEGRTLDGTNDQFFGGGVSFEF
jgi:hypothetical protein